MDKTKKDFQIDLVKETAQRLKADGNLAAASCLYFLSSAMCVNAEQILSNNSKKVMDVVLGK